MSLSTNFRCNYINLYNHNNIGFNSLTFLRNKLDAECYHRF